MNQPQTPDLSTEIVLKIFDLSRGGAGVGKTDSGQVVFVPFTAPGDVVKVLLESPLPKKSYVDGRLIQILEPSPTRAHPRCPVFTECGGCAWQHLPYITQWEVKTKGLKHALTRAGVAPPSLWEEYPAPSPWNYRNRVQLRGTPEPHGKLGFLRRKSLEIVSLPQEGCAITEPEINTAIQNFRSTNAQTFKKPYKVEFSVSPTHGKVQTDFNQRHSAGGFQQVHTAQNVVMKNWVKTEALSPGDWPTERGELIDLYGGHGNLSWDIHPQFSHTTCVDLSVDQAKNTEKYTSIKSPVGDWVKGRHLDALGSRPLTLITDPPRAGMEQDLPQLFEFNKKAQIFRWIHIGCDPDAFARDVGRIIKRGFILQKVAILDLFPQTPHVEALAVLQKSPT